MQAVRDGHQRQQTAPTFEPLVGMLPQNVEAEQAVLGSVLIDPSVIESVAGKLAATDFYLPVHQTIYGAMLELHAAAAPPDILILSDHLQAHNLIDDIGGSAYLASLAALTASSMNVGHYARIVDRLAALRRMVAAGASIQALGFDERRDIDAAMEQATELLAIVTRGKASSNRSEWEDKTVSLTHIHNRLNGDQNEDDAGIPMGLPPLDRLVGGMRRGDLLICGARPSVGKTSLAVTVAHHVALDLDKAALFFSLEMLRERIWEKFVSIEANIPWLTLDRHAMNEQEKQRAAAAIERIKQSSLDVVPAREWAIDKIRAAARMVHERTPLSLIVVDYLQLVTVDGHRENRTQEVSAISQQLKHMALELKCPVLALSQLKRESDMRPSADPVMSELKESGSIEQEADVVILLSRTKEEKAPDNRPTVQRIVTQVAKNRLGKTGKATLGFRGPQMQFVEFSAGKDLPF